MRWTSIFAALTTSFLAAAAYGQEFPPDAVVAGQVQAAYAFGPGNGSWCYVKQGSSEFQRNGVGSIAVISFPELMFYNGTYYPLDGQARLTFTDSADGTIKFKFWGANSVTSPSFSGFSETFNGQQYIVSFNIAFPNGCTLPIYAGYETP